MTGPRHARFATCKIHPKKNCSNIISQYESYNTRLTFLPHHITLESSWVCSYISFIYTWTTLGFSLVQSFGNILFQNHEEVIRSKKSTTTITRQTVTHAKYKAIKLFTPLNRHAFCHVCFIHVAYSSPTKSGEDLMSVTMVILGWKLSSSTFGSV